MTPLVTAHAGCLGTVPNSRASILAAFASRSDIVEVDIRATKDGVVVLTHDDELAMPGGDRVKIEDLAWEEVRAVSARPGFGAESMMSLECFLDLVAELDGSVSPGGEPMLNLDAKESAAMLAAAAILRARGIESRIIFSGLGIEGIAVAAGEIPEFRYLFNADAVVPPGGGQLSDIERACSLARKNGCGGINLEWTRGSAIFVERAAGHGLPVMLWTVDDETDMKTVLSFGPNSITTNRPDLLAALIAKSRGEETHVL